MSLHALWLHSWSHLAAVAQGGLSCLAGAPMSALSAFSRSHSRGAPDSAERGPIDAVITWVDGGDPVLQAKLRAYLATLGVVPEIADERRYRETGEFAYCIASLLRFAPWLRHIYIVTDRQEPVFLAQLRASPWRDKVVVVDHSVLLAGYEQHLPTFNNRTLLSVIWRIPGLAERFIYLNDDFALVRPVQPADFFRGDALVLRGGWFLQPRLERLARRVRLRPPAGSRGGPARPGYHAGQAKAARLAGFDYWYFRAPHVPHALLRSVLAEYYASHPEQLEANVRYRLRSAEQYLGDALGKHLALRQRRAIIDNRRRTLRLKAAHYARPQLERQLAAAARDEGVAFVCLQDLESLAAERRAVVFRWLDERIGRPAEVFSGAEALAEPMEPLRCG